VAHFWLLDSVHSLAGCCFFEGLPVGSRETSLDNQEQGGDGLAMDCARE